MSGSLYVLLVAFAKVIAPNPAALKRTLGFSKLIIDTPLPNTEVHDLASAAASEPLARSTTPASEELVLERV